MLVTFSCDDESPIGQEQLTAVARLLAGSIRQTEVLSHDADRRLLLVVSEASAEDCRQVLKRLDTAQFGAVSIGPQAFRKTPRRGRSSERRPLPPKRRSRPTTSRAKPPLRLSFSRVRGCARANRCPAQDAVDAGATMRLTPNGSALFGPGA